jgi:hypothetical protein
MRASSVPDCNQSARSYELPASLALAELYQEIGSRSKRMWFSRLRWKIFRRRRSCRRSLQRRRFMFHANEAGRESLRSAHNDHSGARAVGAICDRLKRADTFRSHGITNETDEPDCGRSRNATIAPEAAAPDRKQF